MSCQVIKLSVLLPIYYKDSPNFLQKSLTSLISSKNYIDELLIVEDGPVPDSLSYLYKNLCEDINVKILTLDKNYGLAYALNQGLINSKNEYVARMDSDDICSPERFKLQLDFLVNNPDVDILGSYVKIIDENDVCINSRVYPSSDADIKNNIWKCPVAHPTVVYKKSKILSVGGYNPELKRRQDYDLWFRCAISGMEFANLNKYLLHYRQTSDSYEKSSVALAFKQTKIAYKWMPILKVPFYTYLLVLFPLLKSLMPDFIKVRLDVFKNYFFNKF